MGHSALTSQALSAPPYLVAFIVVLLTAYSSDRAQTRSSFIILHALLSACGYLVIAVAGQLHLSPLLRYLALYPACAGFFSAITLIITWTLNNQHSASGRGTGMVMLNVLGQCGPLVGTRLYPKSDGPEYVRGMATCAVCMALVAVLAAVLRWGLRRENAKLERRSRDGGAALMGTDSNRDIVDRSPMYIL
ncbi:MAG: hypothetical protein M1825_005640 [Sarcosagium campestre]|nr:MAG: hypothetical protein M1825_005640 [Sarcosagium campestre]